MQEAIKLIIGVCVLILGIPIGRFLASRTKEELKGGQNWFKLIIFVSLIGTVVSLIVRNDVLLFTFLFIGIVTWESLRGKGK